MNRVEVGWQLLAGLFAHMELIEYWGADVPFVIEVQTWTSLECQEPIRVFLDLYEPVSFQDFILWHFETDKEGETFLRWNYWKDQEVVE